MLLRTLPLTLNPSITIRDGTVGSALAVVRHGGSLRRYEKIPPKSRATITAAMAAVNGLLPISVFGLNITLVFETNLRPKEWGSNRPFLKIPTLRLTFT
jgi:hypothetical protein